MIGWLLVIMVVVIIVGRELLASRVIEDQNRDEDPRCCTEAVREVPVTLYWVIGSGPLGLRRRVYFAADPDMALDRWTRDMGPGFHIEIVTTEPDKAERILGLEA